MSWLIKDTMAPAFDGPLLDNQFVRAAFFTVKTLTQRNNIKVQFRKLDATTTTMVFVSDTNQLYKLVNEPFTTTTTNTDWEKIDLGVGGGLVPVGNWNPTSNTPTLSDAGAAGNNGDFYFVTGAPAGYTFLSPSLFQGESTEVFDGDWIISVGDNWTVLRPNVTWEMIDKPASIDAYVAGTVIEHTHTIANITGLALALDTKFDIDDVADYTIDFDTVPDAKITSLAFLKAHYYKAAEVDSLLTTLGTGINFLALTDTPDTYAGQGLKGLRVNAGATGLEFYTPSTNLTSVLTAGNNAGGLEITNLGTPLSSSSALRKGDILDGTDKIFLSLMPASVIERVYVYGGVAVLPENAGLTTAQVQNGDVVKMTSTGLMYVVVNDAALNNALSYSVFTAGLAASVPWGGVTGTPTTVEGYGITNAWKLGGNVVGATATLGATDNFNLILQTGNAALTFRTNGTSHMRLSAIGNLYIGADTDATARLFVKGTSNESSSNAIHAINSDSVNIFRVRNDGAIVLGTQTTAIGKTITGSAFDVAGHAWIWSLSAASTPTTVSALTYEFTGAGTQADLSIIGTASSSSYTRSSGTSDFAFMRLRHTINTTGSWTGTLTGIDYNPVVTSAAGGTHLAFRSTSGSILFANSSSDTLTASTRLDVRGIASGNIQRWSSSGNTVRLTLTDAGVLNIVQGGLFQLGSDINTYLSSPTVANIHMQTGDSATATTSYSFRTRAFTAITGTNIAYSFVTANTGFAVASGTASMTWFSLNPTYNTTGTYVGVVYGIDYNPTVTALTAGTTHLAIRTTSGSFLFGNSSSDALTGGTKTDIRGIGNTSSTQALRIANSDNAVIGSFYDSGAFVVGQNTNGGIHRSSNGVSISATGDAVVFQQGASANTLSDVPLWGFRMALATPTSGSLLVLGSINTQVQFASSSGNAAFTYLGIKYTLNTQGSYVGNAYGIDYNPTLTNTTGLTHYAIRATSGSVLIGHTTIDASLPKLQVRGLGLTTGTLLLLENSAGTERFRMLEDGTTTITGPTSITTTGTNPGFSLTLTSGAGGDMRIASFGGSFTKSSGTNVFVMLSMNPTVNSTGSHTGQLIGIDYNPTITSYVGNAHIALRIAKGQTIFGANTTPTANTIIDVRGAGTTSSSYSIRAGNSSNVDAFLIRDDGGLLLGNGGGFIGRSTNGNSQLITGQSWMLSVSANAVTTDVPAFSIDFISSRTSGIGTVFGSTPQATFAPTSGTATFTYLGIKYGINATATYVGQMIGIDYNPTLTSLTGVTHYAALFRSGRVGIGLAAPTASLHSRGTDATSANSAAQFENSLGELIAKFRNDLALELGGTSAILEVNAGIPSGNASIRFLANQALGYRFQDSALNDYINMRSTTADKAVIMRQPVEYDYGQTEKRVTRQITITTSTANNTQFVVFEYTLADSEHYDIKVLHADATATDEASITSQSIDAADCRKIVATNIEGVSKTVETARIPASVTTGGFNWNFDTATQKVQYRFLSPTSGSRTFVIFVDYSYVKRLTPEA